MNRPRGRPVRGGGLTHASILAAALSLMGEKGWDGLTMRALAAKLGVSPMSLYHHIEDRQGLLRALSEVVYAEVLVRDGYLNPRDALEHTMLRYHHAICLHPQLMQAIVADPEVFVGVTRHISDYVSHLLELMTSEAPLWRNILIDHAHGSGLAAAAMHGDRQHIQHIQALYSQALQCLLNNLARAEAAF